MTSEKSIVPIEKIEKAILLIRGQRVILDYVLAELYEVETGALNRAVKRNINRFPEDFMFQLTREEYENLRCHFGISNGKGGRRYPPYAFTEQGVAMLSSVLHSERAAQVNIGIMRAFVKLRKIIASNIELAHKLDELEKKYDSQFKPRFCIRICDKLVILSICCVSLHFFVLNVHKVRLRKKARLPCK